MDSFNQTLDDAISSWIKLSEEWEKIENTESDMLSEKYPFDKDFREVLHDLIEWRESLKK
ncbi:hypothetical protein J45TS6_35200 [Paenibacillus sp. J45TS6]|uniref:hypothetical protein n=1 Tax=Paenibacillus sp. J45TS6 TaxID=2807196 RepID=UPI001B2967D0|nr:hypothetical protein [Paenibacillus sp. J45TS6]GIP45061.1 hypothetical protein J45TS6_35200 [Paenibacillus sp. J45TS6]